MLMPKDFVTYLMLPQHWNFLLSLLYKTMVFSFTPTLPLL